MAESTHWERIARLEEVVRGQGAEIEEQGGVLDHVLNTQNTIILPTQERQGADIKRHEATCSEAAIYMAQQRGAWQLVQRIAVILAALASVTGLILKVVETK